MPLKTLLFAGLFAAAVAAALLFGPIWGVLGYVAHYCVGPERQWWAAPLRPLGIRYSYTLALVSAIGILLHWHRMRFGRRAVSPHEILLLVFLTIVGLSALLGPTTVGRYTAVGIDHPSVKFMKVTIFSLMLTHVVTDWKNLQRLFWVFTLSGLMLGYQAYNTPYSQFASGRLERVGGPDFGEANFFGVFMACMLWYIGVKFLTSNWKGKILCFLAGGFAANALILTRSRGATLALAAGGVAAIVLAPRRHRLLLTLGLILAGAGFLYLTDAQFINRIGTIFAAEEQRDASAQSRIKLMKIGLDMWQDHPLGVGIGNFYQTIGRYRPEWAGKDAHNTYVRCLTELGIQGFLCFIAIVVSSFFTLRSCTLRARSLPPRERGHVSLTVFGMACAIVTLLTGCITVSLTYVEFTWWLLMLPVCLDRVVDNMIRDQEAEADDEQPEEPAPKDLPSQAAFVSTDIPSAG